MKVIYTTLAFLTLLLAACSTTGPSPDYDDGRRMAPTPTAMQLARGPEDKRATNHLAALRAPICFSPDEKCDTELAAFISTASKSLDVAVYDINRAAVVSQIIAKSKVMPVRVVVDNRQSKGPKSQVDEMVAAGVSVRYGYQPGGIMHHKFTIVDGEALQIGSFNYTNHASLQNQENQLYTQDPATVDRFVERFEQMWAEGKDVPPDVKPGHGPVSPF